ncbi:NinE family protein [Tatumella sp. UCD-D_suzukii]|uniref:NinE family protein n=1 Tax=Tatumella sp. UCD-D_suzukii TaxID=1408192 RepID=UPI000AC78C19
MVMKHSPTQRAIDNLIFQPTKLSRNKPKPIPIASEVTTYDPGYLLRKRKYDCMRIRRI